MKKIILFAIIAIQTIIAQDKLKVVVLLPESASNAEKGKAFIDVLGGIQRELGDDYVVSKVINNGDNAKTSQIIDAEKPQALVVMENSSIEVVKEFQKKETNVTIPVFATMALQLESSAQAVKNTCGVKLEVPAFTIFSNLKYISKQPFENILVFYLKDFDKDIKKAIEMVQKEQLKLNAICVDCGFDGEMSEKDIAKKMKSEYEKAKDDNKADVLWMLGDNRLLAQKSMSDFWMPKIWSKKVPTIAPLAEMVDPKSPSGKMIGGMMALGADYPELGKQISDQVRRVLEEKEETSAIGFEDIISVQGVLNQKKADKIDWVINPDNVSRMKKIYE